MGFHADLAVKFLILGWVPGRAQMPFLFFTLFEDHSLLARHHKMMIFFGLKLHVSYGTEDKYLCGGVGTSVGAANCCPNYALFYDYFGHYWHLSQMGDFSSGGSCDVFTVVLLVFGSRVPSGAGKLFLFLTPLDL